MKVTVGTHQILLPLVTLWMQSYLKIIATSKELRLTFQHFTQGFVNNNDALYFKLLVTILCFIHCSNERVETLKRTPHFFNSQNILDFGVLGTLVA